MQVGAFQLIYGTTAIYKGVNCQVKNSSGEVFELQFHTSQSFNVKQNLTHGVYEEYRLLDPASARALEFQKELINISKSIDNPIGVDKIK